jgi:hypothetical protein
MVIGGVTARQLCVSYRGDACAVALERVQDCPDLHMRPDATARRTDIALVELCGNGVVAGRAGAHDLIDDGSDIGGKPPRIPLHSRRAAFCSLGELGIA